MSSQISRKVVMAFQHKPQSITNGLMDKLTKRELEILEMPANGVVCKETSKKLFISSETVRKHVHKVYRKLHKGNRVEALNKYFGR